jgi:hypothetical protein
MADINLKTETPDTSLPTTGFLFGADSQAAASPSVYTTQAVATTLLGSTTLSGATITADSPVINASQTWNNGAVAFTGLKFNAAGTSDANSAAASLLMDLQVGAASKFNVSKSGTAYFPTWEPNIGIPGFGISYGTIGNGIANGIRASNNGNAWGIASSTPAGAFLVNSTGQFSFTSGNVSSSAPDTILTRRAAANLRLGAADAAAPVAQTLSVQSVVAGTTNTAGTNLTITGSQGTGTGAGGSIIFQVAPAGSSGTAQNALATALTIDSTRLATFAGAITTTGYVTAGGLSLGSGGAGGIFVLNDNRFLLNSTGYFAFSSNANVNVDIAGDVRLYRDAANTLALRNGANAQESRIYGTFTDASNYRRVASGMSTAGVGFIRPEGAGTGASGNVIHISGLPTSNPGPGILWNNAGTPAIGT